MHNGILRDTIVDSIHKMEKAGNKLTPVQTTNLPSQGQETKTLKIIEWLNPDIVERRLERQAEFIGRTGWMEKSQRREGG